MERLKTKFRTWREYGRRFVRILRYGDTEKVSFFEARSPELSGTRPRASLVSKARVLIARVLQTLRRTYSELLMEDRSLIPDPLHGLPEPAASSYGKHSLDHVYKNAVALTRAPEGETAIAADGDVAGFYVFAGRQLSDDGDGLLEISVDRGTETAVLRKKLSTLETGWNAYYADLPFPSVDGGGFTLRWKMEPANRRAFLSGPVLKTKGRERTVLVLIADAMRPGAIGLYSGGTATPEIDRFFGQGLHFQNSFAQSNWTLPSFASMAISRYASQHHVVDPDLHSRTLDRSVPTLAELMRGKGFFTYGSVSHRRCNHSLGHHRGFEHFRYSQTVESRHKSPGIRGVNDMGRQLAELTAYLRNLKGVPFFGFVHLFDTHFPFFLDPLALNQKHLLYPESTHRSVLKSFRGNLLDEEIRFLEDAFLAKVSELDEGLGGLFRLLEERENVTILLTSDHGYSFANPLGNNLSDEEIRTPFLIRSNEFAVSPGRVARPVESSVDLLPTLVALYGLEDRVPRSGTPALTRDGRIPPKDVAVSELVYLRNYRLRLMDGEGRYALLGGHRNRARSEIDVENLRILEHHGARQLRGKTAALTIDGPIKARTERLLDAAPDPA